MTIPIQNLSDKIFKEPSHRIDKVNKHILRTFSEILQKEADVPSDVMVTVSGVDTAHNLRSADVWLYVSPIEKSEVVMRNLVEQMFDLQGTLNRELNMRPLPRLRLKIDKGADYAESIERKLKELE